jgi:peptidylprolyl isomerase
MLNVVSALLLSAIPAPPDLKVPPTDAVKSPDGLTYKVLRKGEGKVHPTEADAVELHYTGWNAAGTMVDSSVERGKPAQFPLRMVIAGWTRGIPLMVVGEKRRFWIPAALAFGDVPMRPGAPAGPLVYDIELLDILKTPTAPPAPPDVKSSPRSARRTPSGLAYRVLRKGRGDEHPGPRAVVVVHYTGWAPDGKVLDSSIARGTPQEIRVNQAIPGWTEGLQLMVAGEKRRFWVPAHLGHGEKVRDGSRQQPGNLVFDIELLAIKSDGAAEED